VRIYRERPGGKAAPKSLAQALWNYLQAQPVPKAAQPARVPARPGPH
jgi:hypothetical protein